MESSDTNGVAPGAPGLPARWTSSAKSGVGTALTKASRVWFTLSHGILNEVYYPRIDMACTRDLGLIVTGTDGYFFEEKRDADHVVATLREGVPAYVLTNTARDGAVRIEKSVLVDPDHDAVLQDIRFVPLRGSLADYHVHALLAPHLVNAGMGNSAWVGDYKGVPMLFAQGRDGTSLALACDKPWRCLSVGYVGASDGWRQLQDGGRLDPALRAAPDGNVAMAGEVALEGDGGFLLSLAFGMKPEEAGYRALASLQRGFEPARAAYVAGWRHWQDSLIPLGPPSPPDGLSPYRVSTAVLATHRPHSFRGPAVASLSIPWGFEKGDEDLGGYHLVWPRDLVETAGGFLAAGAVEDAQSILAYLVAIQEEDGHWPQNAWLDGTAYWPGLQMDECAFPILLADALRREGAIDAAGLASIATMIERAAGFIVRNGPVTGEDRWEEDPGYSTFTLAVEVAALLAAGDLLAALGKGDAARLVREVADCWNEQIERWTFVTDTEIARKFGVSGYYVRIAPPDTADAASPLAGFVPIKNRPPGEDSRPAAAVVSPDALALVRFGLRAADDPRMVDTVKVIDGLLKVELPQGPLWYRYTGDGYGEKADGSPFDGTGIGRAWPLFAGERAHYEIAAGRLDAAQRLLATFEASAAPGGLLPEQSWDQPDIPERELVFGRPAGSAMPLVWAHAEHIKLLRSLRDGAVFDMPPQGVERYQKARTGSPLRIWRFNAKLGVIPAGKTLRLQLDAPARVHWSLDGWLDTRDSDTAPAPFGLHVLDLPTAAAAAGSRIVFTFWWPQAERWEGADFAVAIVAP